MSINKITLPNGTTHNLVPGAGDITVKSKLYFEAVNEDNVTYKKLVAEYVPPDPEDIDTAGTLTVYGLNGDAIFTMDMNNHRFDFLSVVNMLTAGTLRTSDVVKPSGSTWDGTNTSLATAISSLNSTLNSNLLKSKDVTVTVGTTAYDGYYIAAGDTGLSTSSKLVSVQVIGASNNHAAFVGFYEQSVQKFRVNCVTPNITVYVRVWYI